MPEDRPDAPAVRRYLMHAGGLWTAKQLHTYVFVCNYRMAYRLLHEVEAEPVWGVSGKKYRGQSKYYAGWDLHDRLVAHGKLSFSRDLYKAIRGMRFDADMGGVDWDRFNEAQRQEEGNDA